MITKTALFGRIAETYDFGALWTIEAAVEKDLDAAYAEYQAAIATWEAVNAKMHSNAKIFDRALNYEHDRAYLEMQKKYVAYLEKHMLYDLFNGNYCA